MEVAGVMLEMILAKEPSSTTEVDSADGRLIVGVMDTNHTSELITQVVMLCVRIVVGVCLMELPNT